MTKKSK